MIKGEFISIWDDGIEIRTSATLNPETGQIDAEQADVSGLDILQKERFESEDGNEYEVCLECHEYIIKIVMEDGIGSCFDEVPKCSNRDCNYND